MEDFFRDFTGPQWTTAAFSVAALCVSLYTLYRNRTPKPHWQFDRLTTQQYRRYEEGGYYYEDWEGLAAIFKQLGPGVAESVEVWHIDRKTWVSATKNNASVERGQKVEALLAVQDLKAGDYEVQIRYRTLPNTRKERMFKTTVTVSKQNLRELFED